MRQETAKRFTEAVKRRFPEVVEPRRLAEIEAAIRANPEVEEEAAMALWYSGDHDDVFEQCVIRVWHTGLGLGLLSPGTHPLQLTRGH